MSKYIPKVPYVYQPFAANENNGYLWAVGMAKDREEFTIIKGLTHEEAKRIKIVIQPLPAPEATSREYVLKIELALGNLLAAAVNMADYNKCSFDHHGNCQTHSSGAPCVMATLLGAIEIARGALEPKNMFGSSVNSVEVIGNIHENPDLINNEKIDKD